MEEVFGIYFMLCLVFLGIDSWREEREELFYLI